MRGGHNATDMTGHACGFLRVLARAGSTRGGLALWRCLCDPELGGCGAAVAAARGADLRDGTTTSCGCAQAAGNSRRMTATREGRRTARRLTRHVWPKVCPTCGEGFLGTAKQVYCRPEHRRRQQ